MLVRSDERVQCPRNCVKAILCYSISVALSNLNSADSCSRPACFMHVPVLFRGKPVNGQHTRTSTDSECLLPPYQIMSLTASPKIQDDTQTSNSRKRTCSVGLHVNTAQRRGAEGKMPPTPVTYYPSLLGGVVFKSMRLKMK